MSIERTFDLVTFDLDDLSICRGCISHFKKYLELETKLKAHPSCY